MRDPYAAAAVAPRRPAPRTGRIAVTGLGLITPLGTTLEAFDDALFNARSAVRSHTVALPRMEPFTMGVAACDFDDSERSRSRLPLDRGTAMAMAAARAAFSAAGLGAQAFDGDRLGVYWGSGMAGSASFDATARGLYADAQRVRPTTVLTTMPNAAAAEIGLHFGARGAALSYACACASSAVAVGEAMRAIRGGWIDVAIVGGHEAMLTPGTLASWHAMRVTAPPGGDPGTSCRPFAVNRTGFALGEGAAGPGDRVGRARPGASRRGAMVARRLCHQLRQHPHDPARPGGPGAGHACRPVRRRPAARGHRLHQCARHRHPGRRRGRGEFGGRGLRGARCRSARPSLSTATCWVAVVWWN
jgi:3-oxoacyl-[acyl-carrier-protein] synthase II